MKKLIQINHITDAEREAMQRIVDDCKAMHVPIPPMTSLRFDVYEQGEHVLQVEQLAKSWVRNAYNALIYTFGVYYNPGGSVYGPGFYYHKEIGGTVTQSQLRDLQSGGYQNQLNGIVVGTGTLAENFEHHKLDSVIFDGNASGRLAYTQQTDAGSYNPTTKTATSTFERIFNNNSGATITVNEVGYYGVSSYGGYTYMISRDLISPGIAVVDLAQLKVTYTTTLTFPA